MKSITAVINRILSRAGLHVSRDSSFQGLRSALERAEADGATLRAALELELKKNEHERLLRVSKERWSADEPDPGLTWGVSMSGENFVEFVLQHVTLTDNSIIVEIGPGYGRILNALLSHEVRFRRYIGLEISPRRVNRLSKKFQDPRIEFHQTDILAGVELNATADLTISSAVFEHLYPDFSRAIGTISGFTRPGGAAVIDFVRDESDVDKSSSWFEKETTYIRTYSRNELKDLFEKTGFSLNELQGISFGPDIDNREITRTVVLATKPPAAGPPVDSLQNPIQAASDIHQFDFFVHKNPAPSHDRAITPPVRRQFRTSFGGLWTDLDNAEAIVAGKVAIVDILPAEARLVVDWIRNGFVILPGAVSIAAIDAAMLDFEAAYDGNLGCTMSFWDSEGLHYKEASREHLRKGDAKLLDLHNVSETVQRIIFADAVSRFLHILFERPALAFQSLGFYYGSQQPLHHDYAFVRVSSPLEFVASWIAMEDISPGSGELEYYPGSHLLAPYLFANKNVWVEIGDPELQVVSQNLDQRAREAGLPKQRFLPKKGDVLMWSAGLIHGGSPVIDANLTRKSLVTHYCPADQQPMFVYQGGRPKRKSISGHYVTANIWK
jgi:SAM-dependent methyltransferase